MANAAKKKPTDPPFEKVCVVRGEWVCVLPKIISTQGAQIFKAPNLEALIAQIQRALWNANAFLTVQREELRTLRETNAQLSKGILRTGRISCRPERT